MTEEYSILIKSLSGKTYTIKVTKNMTVSELKAKILSISNQFSDALMKFGMKNLNDEKKKLEDYGINDHSTIYILTRLKGGLI